MIPTDQLDAWQAQCAAAPPGPYHEERYAEFVYIVSAGGGVVARVEPVDDCDRAGAAFIVVARVGWPACIAEVRRLQAQVEALEARDPLPPSNPKYQETINRG